MPIEIRELVIKAVVDADERDKSASEGVEPDRKREQQIIRESVEQTMEILERERER